MNFKTVPFPHQVQALNKGGGRPYFGYLLDLGTGKTKTLLDDAAELYRRGEIDLLLVTTTRFVAPQWLYEQPSLHLSCDYITIKHRTVTARSQKYINELKQFRETRDKLKILVTTYGTFINPDNVKEIQSLLSKSPYNVMWVIDESTRIKTPSAIRTKQIHKLAYLAKYRRILTGSPITLSIMDLWSQFYFLHWSILGHQSYFTFRQRYAVLEPVPTNWVKPKKDQNGSFRKIVKAMRIVSFRNTEELVSKMDPYVYRVKIGDCMAMPEKIFIQRTVPFLPEQKKIYQDVLSKVRVEIIQDGDLHHVDLAHAAARLIKLQEVLSGFLYKNEEQGVKELVPFPTDRAKAAIDIVEETFTPVLIFYWFHYDLDLLSKELTSRDISFTTDSERFKIDEDCRVFLGQLASTSEGLNLQRASTTIFYTNSFNAGFRWQAEARTHRVGQTRSCVYVDLITPNSIDQRILDNLKQKLSYAAMLEDLEKYVKDI